jgi:hypothetical protein
MELWAAEIPMRRDWLNQLREYDHVFVGHKGSVGPLSEFLNRQCHYLPPGIDAIRFSPFPGWGERSIDVYSIGRRCEGIHRALLHAASDQNLFYVYDSFRAMATMDVIDFKQHRDLFASMAKRSKYFLVSPPKMNSPEETRGQAEVGYRYFEGAATGAVMIGQAPDCEAFRELFPWPEAVVDIRPDGSDAIDVLADLASNPARVSASGRRNAVESLLRHDWIHRWKSMFEVCGIEPSQGMVERERRLKELADTALRAPDGVVVTRIA